MKADSSEYSKLDESSYKDLFSHMIDGFALYKIIVDKSGKAIDYQFIEVNNAFEKITGLKREEIIGKKYTVIFPEIKKSSTNWLEIYSEIAFDKKGIKREDYSMRFKKWFYTIAYSPKKGYFATIFEDITEKKKYEEESRKQKQFIESIINLSSDISYIYDIIDKKNVYSNDGIRKVLGYSVIEIQKMSDKLLPILMHPDDMTKYLKEIIPKYVKAKDGEIISNEYRMKHKNGKWIWLECNEQIYKRLPNDSPQQIFGVIHEITAQKNAIKLLKENEEKYKSLFNNSAIGMYRTRLDGSEILEFNEKYCSILGVTRKEIVGQPSKILWVHPEERERMIKTLQSTGHVDELQFQMKRKDGKIIDAVTSVKLFPEQKIIEGSIVDITQRKKAEEEIINSQRLLQRIIDLLPVRVFWKDKNLNYLGCNEIFAKDAGKKTTKELIGKDDFQMNWKEQAKAYREDDANTIKSGKSKLNFEEPQTTPKRDKIWLKTSKMPLTDIQGNTIGILGTYEDITERKKA